MRTLKIIILAVVLLAIVVLALANRELVTLHLLPEGLSRVMPLSIQLPLFVVILLAMVAGVIIGYLFEWLREHKHRRRASQKASEAARLNSEVDRLRRRSGKPEDDVLALLGS